MFHKGSYRYKWQLRSTAFILQKITLKVVAKEKGLLNAYRLISGEISLQKKGKHEYTQKTIPF